MHHAGDADRVDVGKSLSAMGLVIVLQFVKAAPQSFFGQIEGIGPNSVNQLVLPIEKAGSDDIAFSVDQNALDSGRTEFDS